MVTVHRVTEPVRAVGGFFAMSLDTFVLMFRPPLAWREYLLQSWFVARVSMLPVLMMTLPRHRRRLTDPRKGKTDMQHRELTMSALLALAAGCTVLGMPGAHADNKRLNDSVVANVFSIQRQAGCSNDVKINPQLQLAAQWHTLDVLNNRNLGGDIGSDGSNPQGRANAAGFHGSVAETVAINPAVAISGIELMNQW